MTSIFNKVDLVAVFSFHFRNQGTKRENSKDTNVRDDGGLEQSGSSGDGKK